MAAAVLARRIAQLRDAGVHAGGEVVHTFGDHEDAVQAVLDRVDEIGAQVVVVGRKGRVAARAKVPVVVVPA
jgi:nucleotide-binding universal stress UspA family protein